MRHTVGLAVVLALALSFSVDGEEVRARPEAVASFVGRLQQAVNQHDSRAVAALFRFPATVLIGGWRIPMENARTFLGVYDELFTPQLRRQIEQKPAVQVAGDGISLGGGAIWAQLYQGRFRIQRLIVPASSVPHRARQQSRQVASTDPRYPARYAGTLVQDDVDSSVVVAKKGRSCAPASTAFARATPCCAAGCRRIRKAAAPTVRTTAPPGRGRHVPATPLSSGLTSFALRRTAIPR